MKKMNRLNLILLLVTFPLLGMSQTSLFLKRLSREHLSTLLKQMIGSTFHRVEVQLLVIHVMTEHIVSGIMKSDCI